MAVASKRDSATHRFGDCRPILHGCGFWDAINDGTRAMLGASGLPTHATNHACKPQGHPETEADPRPDQHIAIGLSSEQQVIHIGACRGDIPNTHTHKSTCIIAALASGEAPQGHARIHDGQDAKCPTTPAAQPWQFPSLAPAKLNAQLRSGICILAVPTFTKSQAGTFSR